MKTLTSSLEFSHFPVMLNEIIQISAPSKGGIFVDCTFGGGSYSSSILEFPYCLNRKFMVLPTLPR